MGIEIHANGVEQSFRCGYIGFSHLRNNIAMAFDSEFGEAYADILKYFKDVYGYYYKLNQILLDDRFQQEDEDIIDFLYASDCEGEVPFKTCKKIYDLIKDVDFSGRVFIYGAYSDGKDYEHFKDFLKECYEKKVDMRWD